MPDENVLSSETTSKHTPGPWHFDRKGLVGPRSTADDQSRGFIIPVADVYSDNKEEDCRLIAAAPDMLVSLKEAFHELSKLEPDGYEFACLDRISLALAKAECTS